VLANLLAEGFAMSNGYIFRPKQIKSNLKDVNLMNIGKQKIFPQKEIKKIQQISCAKGFEVNC
tara:strand:+ start:6267 stop:6455 length:189 start_codon:yes stop_codon:yes gene_type:complete